jgi:electron transfer flavoprotein alpha subunit
VTMSPAVSPAAGPDGAAVAVIVVRDGRLPGGAAEAVAGAGGTAVVVGSDAETGASALIGATAVWWADTGPGLRPGSLAGWLAPLLTPIPLIVMPASPDGRDLAPRVAALLGRPLVARALTVSLDGDHDHDHDADHDHDHDHDADHDHDHDHVAEGAPPDRMVRATVVRIDDRVEVPVEIAGPAVVTLVPQGHAPNRSDPPPTVAPLPTMEHQQGRGSGSGGRPTPADPEVLAVLEPDLHTMDLADATRVLAGGAGLASGADGRTAVEMFELLAEVAACLGGSAGATRVATDAGWAAYSRQIGTTGVTIDPELYIAFGVSGATQHVSGLGTPRHIVSVNTDGTCPMTAMADLGLVTDAPQLLVELAHRLGVMDPAATAGKAAADGK